MQRDIEFRGYSYIYKKWFYGSLFIRGYDGEFMLSNDETNIIDKHSNKVTVDSSTIGQYTGLNDKNGKKIFEGDIVKYVTGKPDGSSVEVDKEIVTFDFAQLLQLNYAYYLEIIGNIYEDNL